MLNIIDIIRNKYNIGWLNPPQDTNTYPSQAVNILWEKYEKKLAVLFSNKLDAGCTILDAGCGFGAAAKFFCENFNVCAVDIVPSCLNYTKQICSVLDISSVCDLHCLPYDENSMDAVWLSHSIEHTACPFVVLLEAHRVLKPGGHIAILVPRNSEHPTNQHKLEAGHIWEFGNASTLTYMMALAGFECTNAEYYELDYTLGVFAINGAGPIPDNIYPQNLLLPKPLTTMDNNGNYNYQGITIRNIGEYKSKLTNKTHG